MKRSFLVKTFCCVCVYVCVGYLLLLVLRGGALQLSLAPDWLLTVWRVVHRRGSIGVQEGLTWEVTGLSVTHDVL